MFSELYLKNVVILKDGYDLLNVSVLIGVGEVLIFMGLLGLGKLLLLVYIGGFLLVDFFVKGVVELNGWDVI